MSVIRQLFLKLVLCIYLRCPFRTQGRFEVFFQRYSLAKMPIWAEEGLNLILTRLDDAVDTEVEVGFFQLKEFGELGCEFGELFHRYEKVRRGMLGIRSG